MRRLLPLSVLAVVLAACDTGSALDESVVLTKTRTAVFNYACDVRGAGQATTVNASGGLTFVGGLDGFDAADVTSATVTGVTLRRLKPDNATPAQLLRDVRLALGGTTVAQASTLSSSLSNPLTAAGTDVAALVRAGTFTPSLAFTVVQPQATECGFEAELTFRIELPGV